MTQVARGKSLPAEISCADRAQTDGVPLFVEELTRSVLESGLLAQQAIDQHEPGAAARHHPDLVARFADGAPGSSRAGQGVRSRSAPASGGSSATN